jgi:hypothetical protein
MIPSSSASQALAMSTTNASTSVIGLQSGPAPSTTCHFAAAFDCTIAVPPVFGVGPAPSTTCHFAAAFDSTIAVPPGS